MKAILSAILLMVILIGHVSAQTLPTPANKDNGPEWEFKISLCPNMSWKYQKVGTTSKEFSNIEAEGGLSIAYLFSPRLSAGIGFYYSAKAGREELLKDTFTVERLGYLDIPIFLHYTLYDKGKLKPFIELAYVYNRLLSRNAFFTDAGNNKFAEAKESRTDLTNNGYKGSTGSFFIGIGAQYIVSDKFNISLGPYYKTQLSSFLVDTHTNDTRFRSVGLQAVAAFRF